MRAKADRAQNELFLDLIFEDNRLNVAE